MQDLKLTICDKVIEVLLAVLSFNTELVVSVLFLLFSLQTKLMTSLYLLFPTNF